jgi:methionyl-tRNA formyltransferase
VRTVFLGTSEFAAAILSALAQSAHRPELVLTRPARPRGRGRRVAPPPVADTANSLGLPLLQPASINELEARERIAAAKPDVVVVCAFGALIKEPLLSGHEMLNVHPSLLPRWRGAAPVERAIMAGDAETGVSIMRLTAGLDSGPVCGMVREPIAPDDTYGTLAERLKTAGAGLLIDVLDRPRDCTEQPESGITYAEKLGAEDRRLDPERPAEELERVVRALSPHIGAFVELDGGARLGVWQARVAEDSGLRPGELDLSGSQPAVGCGRGELELLVVQPAGGRAMPGDAYLRGHRR